MAALVIGVICGIIATAIASSKNRSPVGWFFIGFFTGIIGIIIVAVLDDPEEKSRKDEALQRSNRRLREELSQERMKNERREQVMTNRLDAHDEALNMNTTQLDSTGDSSYYSSSKPKFLSGSSSNESENE